MKKVKEPVSIRLKSLSNGNKSIYLDMYVNGVRTYKFLKMYLIPEKTKQDRQLNIATMEAANNIKATTIININNRRAGIAIDNKVKLFEYFQTIMESKKGSSKSMMSNTFVKLKTHCNDIRIVDVDKKYINLFVAALKSEGLSGTTIKLYYDALSYVFNRAKEEDIISESPFSKIKRSEIPRKDVKEREFLTIEEFKMLYNSKPSGSIERMFLFSCLTGLRLCDAMSLKWSEINEGRIVKTAKKTGKCINMKLSKLAIPLIVENNREYVFEQHCNSYISIKTQTWIKSMGINKYITFHCSRHTFATMELTLGADIYTTSKLLGHSSVSMTQIYAKIIDKKKDDAIDALESII